MSYSSAPDHDPPLDSLSLDDLQRRCEAQLAAFHQSRDRSLASPSCEEILRRAAQRDADAFARLWQVSAPLARKLCPAQCRAEADDLLQEVAISLLRKFRHATSPYQSRSFAEYRNYLKLTVAHACFKQPRLPPTLTLDALAVAPSQPPADTVMRHAFYERCLTLLPDELHREAFYRRFVRGEDPDAIAAALRDRDPTMTTKNVYRLIENCIKRLAILPEIRDMLESDGGNDL
jgi:DNA-directed RNA polymerase specialized sigma24 family protein